VSKTEIWCPLLYEVRFSQGFQDTVLEFAFVESLF